MSQKSDRTRTLVRTGLALATTLFPLPLLAQTEAPVATPPAAPAPAAPAEAPAPGLQPAGATLPAPPQVAQAVVAPAPAAEPTVAATVTPPADAAKPLEVNVWGRIGNTVTKKKNVDADTAADAEVNLLLNGSIHPKVNWTADFVATYGPGLSGSKSTASILDLIAKFDFDDAFHIWFGRMLVPSDRSNFSGAWFMSPWAYPGVFVPGSAPIGPRQGEFGRNDGATIWGQFGGGLLKYYAGAFGLTTKDATGKTASPLFTSRINLSLINPEPGYYHSSTYYGGKDILAIGLSGQYQKDGSAPAAGLVGAMADDYTGFSVDVLFEKNTGAGTLDVEGAFYGFAGDNNATKNYFYALASYLIPGEIGIGRLQPLVRYQQAQMKDAAETKFKLLDAQVGYAIKEYAARVALGYQRFDLGGDLQSNAFILGIQLQK